MINPGSMLLIAGLIVFVQVMVTLFASFQSGFTSGMTYVALWIAYLQVVGFYIDLSPDLLGKHLVIPIAFVTFFTIQGITTYIRVLQIRSS